MCWVFSDFPTAPDFNEMVQFFMLIPMVCLFFCFVLFLNEKVTALQSYFFLSICEEIQFFFFADGSEIVIFAVQRRCFKYISRLRLG